MGCAGSTRSEPYSWISWLSRARLRGTAKVRIRNMIGRCRQRIIRLQSQDPMRRIVSYRMNSSWRANDKLFMLPREELQRASTLVAWGGCRHLRLFLWSAVYWSPPTCWWEELWRLDRHRQSCQMCQAQVRLSRVHPAWRRAYRRINRARITSSG
jgi:hypothetical protein